MLSSVLTFGKAFWVNGKGKFSLLRDTFSVHLQGNIVQVLAGVTNLSNFKTLEREWLYLEIMHHTFSALEILQNHPEFTQTLGR